MKRILIGLLIGLILSMVLSTSVLAAPPQGAGGERPRTIHITPGEGGSAVQFNTLPDNGRDLAIVIETPQGTKVNIVTPGPKDDDVPDGPHDGGGEV